MKKTALIIILLLFFVSIIPAQELPKITIVNNTGYPVYRVFISPSTDDNWGDPFLDNEIIASGESVEFILKFPLSVTNVYDIALFNTDDDTYSKYGVQVKANERIVFTFDDFVKIY